MRTNLFSAFFCTALLILSCGLTALRAGTYSELNVIGFSKDGKYLAFEEFGTQDGSGFPFASIYFIDVEQNAYAAPPVTQIIKNETATETTVRSRVKLAAAKKLQQFKIVRGNSGKKVISRLLTDLDADNDTQQYDAVQKLRFSKLIGSLYREGDYGLTLKPIETKAKDCEMFDLPTYKFELTLTDNKTNATKTLQKDAALPKSRYCPFGYRIQDVYVYENNLAVFINVYGPGFEGEDMSFMVVTGKLN